MAATCMTDASARLEWSLTLYTPKTKYRYNTKVYLHTSTIGSVVDFLYQRQLNNHLYVTKKYYRLHTVFLTMCSYPLTE